MIYSLSSLDKYLLIIFILYSELSSPVEVCPRVSSFNCRTKNVAPHYYLLSTLRVFVFFTKLYLFINYYLSIEIIEEICKYVISIFPHSLSDDLSYAPSLVLTPPFSHSSSIPPIGLLVVSTIVWFFPICSCCIRSIRFVFFYIFLIQIIRSDCFNAGCMCFIAFVDLNLSLWAWVTPAILVDLVE